MPLPPLGPTPDVGGGTPVVADRDEMELWWEDNFDRADGSPSRSTTRFGDDPLTRYQDPDWAQKIAGTRERPALEWQVANTQSGTGPAVPVILNQALELGDGAAWVLLRYPGDAIILAHIGWDGGVFDDVIYVGIGWGLDQEGGEYFSAYYGPNSEQWTVENMLDGIDNQADYDHGVADGATGAYLSIEHLTEDGTLVFAGRLQPAASGPADYPSWPRQISGEGEGSARSLENPTNGQVLHVYGDTENTDVDAPGASGRIFMLRVYRPLIGPYKGATFGARKRPGSPVMDLKEDPWHGVEFTPDFPDDDHYGEHGVPDYAPNENPNDPDSPDRG